MLPNVCFRPGVANLTIYLNDVKKQSHSSLFSKSKCTLNVYAVVTEVKQTVDFIKPNLIPIYSHERLWDMNNDGVYEIRLNKPDYMKKKLIVEVFYSLSSLLLNHILIHVLLQYKCDVNSNDLGCVSKQMCVDESVEDNKLECIHNEHCNKLVAFIQISSANNKAICISETDQHWKHILLHFGLRKEGPKPSGLKANFIGSAFVPISLDLYRVQLPPYLVEYYEAYNPIVIWIFSLLGTVLAILLAIATVYFAYVSVKTYLKGLPTHLIC